MIVASPAFGLGFQSYYNKRVFMRCHSRKKTSMIAMEMVVMDLSMTAKIDVYFQVGSRIRH